SPAHLPPLPSSPTRRSSDLSPNQPRPYCSPASSRLRQVAIMAHDSFGSTHVFCVILIHIPHIKSRIGPVSEECDLTEMRRAAPRSEEHTSELQSRENLVCRL